MKKILFIVNEKNYTTEVLKTISVDVDYTYKKVHSIFIRFIRRLWAIFNIPYYNLWFNFKRREINRYELIIIYECKYPEKIIKYIRNKNKNARIIYWLWNTIDKIENYRLYSPKRQIINLINKKELYNCEIWSFDKKDCLKYNLLYNNQVAYKINIPQQKIKYDFFFAGKDKNRLSIIKELKTTLKKYKFKILILPDRQQTYSEKEQKYILLNMLPYKKIIEYLNQSKCIIDIVQEGQKGITWRPLEAMFYKKKLLTNYTDIYKYDFYNKNNIFILGKDDFTNIDIFINSTYENLPEKIINKYTAKGWLDNFINHKNI